MPFLWKCTKGLEKRFANSSLRYCVFDSVALLSQGPARAVIRAVPIAVLKPLIGASEAVSKTLLGIHGTLNPDAQLDTAVKYKQR